MSNPPRRRPFVTGRVASSALPRGILVVAAAALALTAAAAAAELAVVVPDQATDAPVAGVAVCPGTGDEGRAPRTDAQGSVVSAGVSPGISTALVSADGNDTVARELRVPATGAQETSRPQSGSDPSGAAMQGIRGTPADATQLQIEPAPRILSFEINGGARVTTSRDVTLTATFDRQPMFYRAAEGDEIRNAPWLRTPQGRFQVDFTLVRPSRVAPFGTRTVSLEVKPGPDEASISPPSEQGIVLAPARTRSYVLTGVAAAGFVEEARRHGAQFGFTVSSASPDGFAEALCGESGDMRPAPGRGTPDLIPGSSDRYTEHARFDVFQGVDFNPFWQLKDVKVRNILYRPVTTRVYTNRNRAARQPETVSFEPHLDRRQVLVSREMQLTAPPAMVLQQVKDRLRGVDPGAILPALPPTIDCVTPGKTVVFSLTLEGPDVDGEIFDPLELALAPQR